MKYLKISEISKKWNIPTRTIRNYCYLGKIKGVKKIGKIYYIPFLASPPIERKEKNSLLKTLREQKKLKLKGSIYHKLQVEFAYNSNHIEGSKLTLDQTRFIYETNTIALEDKSTNVNDIIEVVNHFRCLDFIIDKANYNLSEKLIKQIHFILKINTFDTANDWFIVGDYKKYPNEVGGYPTTSPQNVKKEMSNLLNWYNSIKVKTANIIIEFHYRFEKIHPFQDGNGRVGRLIMFKECLKQNIIPFIINDNIKLFYYRGLKNWEDDPNFLIDTCLSAQDKFKTYLDYFKIK